MGLREDAYLKFLFGDGSALTEKGISDTIAQQTNGM
jgi:hypothetical protein